MSASLTSSEFLSCTAFPTTVTATSTATSTVTFTTEYCTTLRAACPTGEWIATYTIKEVCIGNPAIWTPPAIPPNFVESTVTCDVCHQKTQVITCPVSMAQQTGSVTIQGNGVTAAAPAAETAAGAAPGDMGASATMPMAGDNAAATASAPFATAGAASLKQSLALLGTAFLIAGQLLM